MVDPVPTPDIQPKVCPNIPQLNISTSEDTDFMEKEVAGMSLVALETREDCLIGSISDLFLKGDTIIVVDGQKAKRIMLFNRQGKLLRQIGNVGSGPGEYSSITQARISPEGIEINDWQTSRFIKYDYEGNVLKEVTFQKNSPSSLYHIGNDHFLATQTPYFERWPFALQWLENDSVVASAFPFTMKRNEVAASIFTLNKNKIGFHIPFSDTIYSISDQMIIPEFTLGVMNSPEVQDYLVMSATMDIKEKSKFLFTDSRAPLAYERFFSTDDHLIITFQKQTSMYLSIIDWSTWTCRNYLRGAINPITSYFPTYIKSATGNTLIGFFDEDYPLYLPDESREFIEKHFSPEDRQLLQTYDYGNNNPIVWLMELK